MSAARAIHDAASEALDTEGYLVHRDEFFRAYDLILRIDRIGY